MLWRDELRLMEIFNSLEIKDLEQLKIKYIKSKPFPHLVIDGFLQYEIAKELEDECREISTNINVSDNFQQIKKSAFNDWSLMPNSLSKACLFFNSGNFLNFLESVTNIKGLISDPFLEGGGMHQTKHGGLLKMHTDFNWHKKMHLHRRLNVLFYLNYNYEKNWDGKLLLSNDPTKESTENMASIEPIFNRLVIFNTNDKTFHGHPDPLNFPKTYPRTSLAFYYYTSSKRPKNEQKRFNATSTRYIFSINEKFSGNNSKLKSKIGYFLRRWFPFF